MPVAVGGTNITDIRVGSTLINYVYVGSQLVWSRLSLSTSPTSGHDVEFTPNSNSTAQVTVFTNPSTNVAWTFTVNSQSGNGTLSYGASTGTSTFVRLVQTFNSPQEESSAANVTVNAVIGGTVVASSVCQLSANTIFITEGGRGGSP